MSTFFAVMAVLLFVTILGGVTGVLTVDKIKSLFAKPTNQRLPPTSQRINAQELQVIILHKIENIAEFGVLKQTFNSSFIGRAVRPRLWGYKAQFLRRCSTIRNKAVRRKSENVAKEVRTWNIQKATNFACIRTKSN